MLNEHAYTPHRHVRHPGKREAKIQPGIFLAADQFGHSWGEAEAAAALKSTNNSATLIRAILYKLNQVFKAFRPRLHQHFRLCVFMGDQTRPLSGSQRTKI